MFQQTTETPLAHRTASTLPASWSKLNAASAAQADRPLTTHKEKLAMQFETVQTQLSGHVAIISFNRPDKANALNWQLWQDIRSAMRWADTTAEVRVVILRGEGKHFTAGIDLQLLQELAERVRDDCGARSREKLRATILDVQDCLTAIERCRKPVGDKARTCIRQAARRIAHQQRDRLGRPCRGRHGGGGAEARQDSSHGSCRGGEKVASCCGGCRGHSVSWLCWL